MKIAEIDYPAELLAAIRSQRLVVFAGAGISMGEPAGLPSFDRLAQQIAEGTAQGPSEGETTDRFLGRLKAAGVKVHEIAAKRLSQGEPQPNPLHHNLIRCFTRDDRVRVVTTNFDQLFERAAEVQEILELPIYSAPALPLGRAFRGLVHVHGSLLQPETMTLTDEDFGRGYLTEGWRDDSWLICFGRTPCCSWGTATTTPSCPTWAARCQSPTRTALTPLAASRSRTTPRTSAGRCWGSGRFPTR